MKRLEYQEESVEHFTTDLEMLVAKRDGAEKFAELARAKRISPRAASSSCNGSTTAAPTAGAVDRAERRHLHADVEDPRQPRASLPDDA